MSSPSLSPSASASASAQRGGALPAHRPGRGAAGPAPVADNPFAQLLQSLGAPDTAPADGAPVNGTALAADPSAPGAGACGAPDPSLVPQWSASLLGPDLLGQRARSAVAPDGTAPDPSRGGIAPLPGFALAAAPGGAAVPGLALAPVPAPAGPPHLARTAWHATNAGGSEPARAAGAADAPAFALPTAAAVAPPAGGVPAAAPTAATHDPSHPGPAQALAAQAASDARTPSQAAAAEPAAVLAAVPEPPPARRREEPGSSPAAPNGLERPTLVSLAGVADLSGPSGARAPEATSARADAGAAPLPLGQDLSYWSSHGVHTGELRLNDASFDTVNIRVRMEGQDAQVSFATDQHASRAWLSGSTDRLQDLLGQSGINLTQVSVSASASGGQGQAPPQPQAPVSPTGPVRAAPAGADPASGQPPERARRSGPGQVDLFV